MAVGRSGGGQPVGPRPRRAGRGGRARRRRARARRPGAVRAHRPARVDHPRRRARSATCSGSLQGARHRRRHLRHRRHPGRGRDRPRHHPGRSGPKPREGVPVEEIKRELYTRLTARPDTEVRLVLDQPPVRRVLARQQPVPGFGWARFAPAASDPPGARSRTTATGSVTLTNGLVTVAVDPADGTFATRRPARLRPPGRRRRPRRHLQLLAPATDDRGRHARHRCR